MQEKGFTLNPPPGAPLHLVAENVGHDGSYVSVALGSIVGGSPAIWSRFCS